MDAAVTALTPENEAALLAEATPAQPPSPWQRIRELPPRNKWMAALGLLGLVAVLVMLATWNKAPAQAPLFTGSVSDKDSGAAVAQLTQLNVPYTVTTGGLIMVPADRVGELRMKMASAGLPKGSVNGFELLDNARFGQSQHQERANWQRALEGELTRTISTLQAVESARVHLAMPQMNGFYREQLKPSASVLLTLHPGHALDKKQVAGIVHLVSSSVPDLAIKAVSVIDQDGNLLSSDTAADGRAELTQQQRKYVAHVEDTLRKRVQEILEPALGKDNLRATVTADVDFSEVEQASESYGPNQKPENAAIRSQHNLETQGTGLLPPTGVPGAASNQPPTSATAPLTGASAPLQPAAGGGTSGNVRKENQVNYEVDRTVVNRRNQAQTLKRVNVAVLVNYRQPAPDPKAKTPPKPEAPSAEELQKLTALVQEAVGFNKDRGDSVKVEALPFRIEAPAAEPPIWKQPWVVDLLRASGIPAALTLIALILIFAVIRPALKKDEPPEPEPEALEGGADAAGENLNAVVDGEEQLPALEDDSNNDPLGLESPDVQKRLVNAREMVHENPLMVANILKSWMAGEETA